MIKIKESNEKTKGQLWRWLNYEDVTGKKGIDKVKDNIIFVNGTEKADIGISWHGEKVEGISPTKCILMKNEPPIYNVFFGRNLSDERFTKIYLKTMASHKINNTDVYYNIPRYEFSEVSKYFDVPKTEFMCMVLRNKKWSRYINKFDVKNTVFNKNSLLKYRKNMDKFFCKNLGKNKYHSYGGPWMYPCYQGQISDGIGDKWETMSKYKFTFCPENSRFDGYVTEKPIQPMCMGSIPIYLGAPDVYDYLPEGTFIHADDYKPKELLDYIKYMSKGEYMNYIKRIRKFITTEESKKFSSVEFAKKFMGVVEEIK